MITAAVQTGQERIELVEFATPRLGDDDAILRVEACGICGTDVERYLHPPSSLRLPLVPGHEPVGVIDAIGAQASARWDVRVGDRVAVDAFIPCGSCRVCLDGNYEFCDGRDGVRSYGSTPTTIAPGVWGGFATHMYLHRDSLVYRIPDGIDPAQATLYNPLGAGVKWGVMLPATTIGSTVLILGAGQRGLACLIAAKAAGAGLVVITGLGRDHHKLDLAREFGADATVDVDVDDVQAVVRSLTNGRGVDIAIDTTPGAARPVADAVAALRMGGTLVLGGLKGHAIDGFPSDDVALKALTVRGARGVGAPAYKKALSILATSPLALHRLRTHEFALADADAAVRTLAGLVEGEHAVNVVIRPDR